DGLRSLGTLPQKSQSFSSNLGREFANEDAALDDDRNARQSHAYRCDACRRICLRLVANKAIVRIAAVEIVQERRKLQTSEVFVGGRSTKIWVGREHFRHEDHSDHVGMTVIE